MSGGAEETTTGLLRLRRLEAEGRLACPVVAVNESRTERTFNDRYGTGQSALDGILRATNLLLAGRTLVLFGYGATGKGIAQRARGAGATVIVCEVDPLRALEARMDAFEVMPALEAAERGDLFVTVTGSRAVLRREHFERMRDGAVLANAGHFDVEIDLDGAARAGRAAASARCCRSSRSTTSATGGVHLLASGRVVNLAAGEGHPAAVMDMSFANLALAVEHLKLHRAELENRVLAVPKEIDEEIARLKLESLGRGDRLAHARAARVPELLGPRPGPLRPVRRASANGGIEGGPKVATPSSSRRGYHRCSSTPKHPCSRPRGAPAAAGGLAA